MIFASPHLVVHSLYHRRLVLVFELLEWLTRYVACLCRVLAGSLVLTTGGGRRIHQPRWLMAVIRRHPMPLLLLHPLLLARFLASNVIEAECSNRWHRFPTCSRR
jgi:hypothetical protein